jgi:DNA-directed RNA polymerase subunit RPC12/RpoP
MIRFACENCSALQIAPESQAGQQARCRKCGERLVIPADVTDVELAEARQILDAMRRPNRTPPQDRPPSRTVMGAIYLWGAGLLLFLVALIVSNNLDNKDAQSVRYDNARYDAQVAVGGPATYQVSPKSDRTPVYLLAGLGGLCLALGVVCWALSGDRGGKGP